MSVKREIKNVEALRTKLIDVFEGIEAGLVRSVVAKEMNNCAGKIINSLKTQLEYAALRKEKPDIPFLNC